MAAISVALRYLLDLVMDKVTFRVNGIEHSVGSDVKSTTTLLDYLRRTLELRGTKYMCLEGACGACLVSTVKSHGEERQSVNSCLVAIASCQGWDIKTIENVGNRLEGYHPLQTTLAKTNGSQCGYCSPGMIMNMYSLVQSRKLTMLEIEKALGSNICRCTGYRPIIQAFKKFATDAPEPISLSDIEDLKICEKSGKACSKQKCDQSEWCFISQNEVVDEVLHIKLKDNRDWYRANTLDDVFAVLAEKGVESYMLVAGNTTRGVSGNTNFARILIDISGVPELKGFYMDQNLVIGCGNTISEVIDILKTITGSDGFSYLNAIIDHLEFVANVCVRNLATLAGNLYNKNLTPTGKSDVFLLLQLVGAEITILSNTEKKVLSAEAFLKESLSGKVILNVILPPLSDEHKVVTYKMMARYQNTRPLIHAGFHYKIDQSNTVQECKILYGGLSSSFGRAYKTENYLRGKNLFVNKTLQGAVQVLNKEMVVVESLPEPSVQYRRQAALGLFYKSLLSCCPPTMLGSRYRSGAINLKDTRPVSEGHQEFDTNPNLWPLNKPFPKVDAMIQCAGEAKYTDDTPSFPGELYLAFVLAKVPLGTIEKIDTSRALSEPGVVAFYSASDIPGENSFIPAPNLFNTANEELFCNGQVKYYDQPVGVVCAEDPITAEKAAALVEVHYTNIKKPLIDVKDAKNDSTRVSHYITKKAKSKGNDVVKVIKGDDNIYGQYHFTMETIVSIVHPTEEGLKMYATTQWIDLVQQATSRVLKLEQNRIDVTLRRLGGGYGIKIARPTQMAVATALAAYKLNRPCRFVNPMNVNMRAIGKRAPCSRDYEVGVDANGAIQYLNYNIYIDNGYVFNEPIVHLGLDVFCNCYKEDLWNYTAYNALTDTASNTWCRSPGTLENVAMAEMMMERIAYELDLDPLEVRLANLDTEKHGSLLEMIKTMKNNSQYYERKAAVDTFNKSNRWKKRGLRFSLLKWTPFGGFHFDVNLCAFADDGSVCITHGGVEMGQGINTMAIQVCAYLLNIPIEKVQVKPNDTVIAPNSSATGSSLTTQNIAIGVRRCCEELLRRLEPVRSQMSNPSWVELIKKAYNSQVDLQVHGFTTLNDFQVYEIYGVALAEVEIDVLNGEHQILQVDLIQDVGQSINPELDIGQVEGAFMMGVGYWTSENLVYEPSTGELLTNRTWEYWVPQARDIPQILRIYLRKRSYSTEIIFGSKATGEPSICMGVVVAFALRAAIAEARRESGIPTTQWFEMDGPFNLDKICVATATKMEDFRFN